MILIHNRENIDYKKYKYKENYPDSYYILQHKYIKKCFKNYIVAKLTEIPL